VGVETVSRGRKRVAYRRTQEAKDELPLPEYFAASGMLRDRDWVESYISMVLQWPKSCTIPTNERHLIGLAKALAFAWEPGILNHTDLALATGFRTSQVNEAIKAASATLGLAELDRATAALGRMKRGKIDRVVLKPVANFFGAVPPFLRHRMVIEDRKWFRSLLTVARPAYDTEETLLDPRLRALICLAASAVVGWGDGTYLYSAAAKRFGASEKDTSDVIRSVFKTTVSNAMASGFRTPCHVPNLKKYRTLLKAYVENGALMKSTKGDPLNSRP
jgi:alkylhydroperoxidase/carboxymuconolactone decarboxylase family protein YurZ